MKRIFGVFLGATLAFSAGCASDDETAGSSSFTASYDLGLYVKMAERSTSETKNYVNLNGVITQVDDLAAQATTSATSGVCEIDPDMTVTVMSTDVSATTSVRVVGTQKAWILPSSYYNADRNWEIDGGGVHVWGDFSNGDIFLSEPNLDIWLQTQAEAECNCRLDQYLSTTPVLLHLFETESEKRTREVSQVTWKNPDFSHEAVDVHEYTAHTVGSFSRFVVDGLVWETYDAGTDGPNAGHFQYGANMILPDSVRVGDTWVDDGVLAAAVGIETVAVAGKRVRALHVVYRGTHDTDAILSNTNECIEVVDTLDQNNDGTITKAKKVALKPACRINGAGSGWINQRHVWYYKGIPIKEVEEGVEVEVFEYGLVAGNDGNLPGATVPVGDCQKFTSNGNEADSPEVTSPADEPEVLDRLQTYIGFSVRNYSEVNEAIEIRDNYSIVTEYRESL